LARRQFGESDDARRIPTDGGDDEELELVDKGHHLFLLLVEVVLLIVIGGRHGCCYGADVFSVGESLSVTPGQTKHGRWANGFYTEAVAPAKVHWSLVVNSHVLGLYSLLAAPGTRVSLNR
jgi:hypothetical protein